MTELDRFNHIYETLIDNRNQYRVAGNGNEPDIWVGASLGSDPTRRYVRVPTIGRIATYKIDDQPEHSDRTDLYRHPGLITVTHSLGVPRLDDPNGTVWGHAASVSRENQRHFVDFWLGAIESALANILSPAA